MSVLVDTSVLIDVLRGREAAVAVLRAELAAGSVHASEITRAEVLGGMRESEEAVTRALLSILTWHPIDHTVSVRMGELARAWRRTHSGIDIADYAIAATAQLLGVRLLTRNVRHFPMIEGLVAPY